MWRCSSRSTSEKPFAEARVQVVVLHVLEDQPLAGHREHALDDQVVGADALDEQVEVVGSGLDPVGDVAQAVVERRRARPGSSSPRARACARAGRPPTAPSPRRRSGRRTRCAAPRPRAAWRGTARPRRSAPPAGTAPGPPSRAPRRCRTSPGSRPCAPAGLGRRRHPLLLVDREVELVRLPVLLLPQRVELAVVEQLAAGRAACPRTRAPGSPCPGDARAVGARAPASRARACSARCSLSRASSASSRPWARSIQRPEQRDRVDLALDRRQLQAHRVGGRQLAG